MKKYLLLTLVCIAASHFSFTHSMEGLVNWIWGSSKNVTHIEKLKKMLADGKSWTEIIESAEPATEAWSDEVIRWALFHGAPTLQRSGIHNNITEFIRIERAQRLFSLQPLLRAMVLLAAQREITESLTECFSSLEQIKGEISDNFIKEALTSKETELNEDDAELLKDAFLLALGQHEPVYATMILEFLSHNFVDEFLKNMLNEGLIIAALNDKDSMVHAILQRLRELNPSTYRQDEYVIKSIEEALNYAIAQGNVATVKTFIEHITVYEWAVNRQAAYERAQHFEEREPSNDRQTIVEALDPSPRSNTEVVIIRCDQKMIFITQS